MKDCQWRIKDLVDLEYFLGPDEEPRDSSGPSLSAKRDRVIYLKDIEPLEQGEAFSPRRAIRLWLETCRRMERAGPASARVLPGEAFEEILRVLRYILLTTGLLMGSASAFSYLNYRGTEPLNVSVYFGGFVLTQALLLLLLAGMSMIRVLHRSFLRSSVVSILIGSLFAGLMVRLRRHASQSLAGSFRGSLEGVVGLIKGKRQLYSSLFYWPLFLLAQIFWIGFNLGVVSATHLKVLGSDVAFGWQSTVQFGSRLVSDLVRALAVPWSWFVPADIACPSLSEIEGSRMVLKDGIYHLATQDLGSWWPFLCLAILFYGLLPRVILVAVGLVVQNRLLARLAFHHGASERLLKRMRTPLVSTEGSSLGVSRTESGDGPVAGPATQGPGMADANKGLIAMVPAEVFDQCSTAELDRVASRKLGRRIGRKLRFGGDEKGDREIL